MGEKSKRKSSSSEAKEDGLGFDEVKNQIDDFTKDKEIASNGDVDLGRNVQESNERNKKKRKRDAIEEQFKITVEERRVGEKRKTMDEQFRLSKEEFEIDDETQLSRTIVVDNLPLNLNKKALFQEFTKFGEVESVSMPRLPLGHVRQNTKGAKMKEKIDESLRSVHAYIVFKDEKSAQASLTHNMTVVGGNHIHVDQACPPRKKLKGFSSPIYDSQRTVFVDNLPFDVKDKEIYQLVCGIDRLESSIEVVRVIRDPNSSAGKGIAYVLFKTGEAANLVIRKRHLMIRDCLLRFYHAKSDATPSRKRNLPTTDVDNSSKKRSVNTSTESCQEESKSGRTEDQDKDGNHQQTGEKIVQKPNTALGDDEVKECEIKQPVVGVGKAKTLNGVGSSRQTGLKRKPDGCTPDSSHQKKARKM